MSFKSILLGASVLLLSTSANAANIDQGSITLDTATGLEWLDVTETTNLSYNQVINELGENGQFYGYRYATIDELQQLLTNIGFSGVSTIPNRSLVFQNESALLEQTINLLGDTYKPSYTPSFPGDVLLSGATYGMVEYCCNSLTGSTFPTRSNIRDFDYGDTNTGAIDYSYDYIQLYGGGTDLDAADDRFGSFLVKGIYSPVATVPVPAAVWLFGSGLIGLIGVARRKKA